ncbi:MAG: SDR family oxidoreductase [Caldilineaceae bacterium]|nr:SDR family oxidoreductase [Caldilineaceae bacterium]
MILRNKTAVVTGASSGIGRAIANSLAQEGMHVYITGQNAARLASVCAQITKAGGRVQGQAFDLRDSEKLMAFIQQAKEETGRLDVMINNAGVNVPGTIAEADPQSWRMMIDINIFALLAGSQAAIRAMRQNEEPGGHLINISSSSAKVPATDVYSASKHMVNALCDALSKQLTNEAILVTNIMPGAVATNLGRNYDPAIIQELARLAGMPVTLAPGELLPDEVVEQVHTKLGHFFLNAEDIAQAVLYALSQPRNVAVRELYLRTPQDIAI